MADDFKILLEKINIIILHLAKILFSSIFKRDDPSDQSPQDEER
jgi:hypothetical protein